VLCTFCQPQEILFMSVTAETGRASRPDERECAMLIAHLLATRQEEVEKEVTRARLSELTLRRLFQRQQITPDFLAEVQEWLFRTGWVLFFAGTTYAVVKVRVIDGWGRISSKRIGKDLDLVAHGQFGFEKLEKLLLAAGTDGADED
jgi:hypothetical protein